MTRNLERGIVTLTVEDVKMKNSSDEKLTFRNLEDFINHWTLDIQENCKVFSLQASAINELLLDTCSYHENLEFLHRRMILAKCFQGQIDMNIGLASALQNEIASNLEKLEKGIACCCRNIPQDVYRKHTYEIAEQINTKLMNLESALQLLESKTNPDITDDTECFDVRGLTDMLRFFCRQLENIEVKTYQLRDALTDVFFHKHRVLRLLRLKENYRI
ncbi:hypothetical protein JTB14_012936 [Gonioctena quinquepunctata]|nr:hypothetical protein JTB14_012936 [Gonioctena quinquepunctata]